MFKLYNTFYNLEKVAIESHFKEVRKLLLNKDEQKGAENKSASFYQYDGLWDEIKEVIKLFHQWFNFFPGLNPRVSDGAFLIWTSFLEEQLLSFRATVQQKVREGCPREEDPSWYWYCALTTNKKRKREMSYASVSCCVFLKLKSVTRVFHNVTSAPLHSISINRAPLCDRMDYVMILGNDGPYPPHQSINFLVYRKGK